MRFISNGIIALIIIFATRSTPAWGAPTVSLLPNGENRYIIQGYDLKGVMSASIQIFYDALDGLQPSVIPSVSVTESTARTGFISIDVKSLSPLNGNLALGVINLSGSITSASAWLQNMRGGADTVAITVPPPQVPDGKKAEMTKALRDQKAARQNQPPEPIEPDEHTSVKSSTRSEYESAPIPRHVIIEEAQPGASENPAKNTSRIFRRNEGLMKRFLSLGEDASGCDLFSLLKETGNDKFRQVPPLELSDGASVIKVFFDVSNYNELQCVILSGCRVVSLVQEESGGWVLELRPDGGVLEPTITVVSSAEMVEYPLAVVPPLPGIDHMPSDPAVAGYIAAANALLSDCNGDAREPSR